MSIDARSDAGGAEAVIDVHYGHVGCATVQHPEKGSDPAETGAVPDAGRYGDHRNAHEPAHHARERAFHSGDADDHSSRRKFLAMLQQAVNACNADVIQWLGAITHHTRGQQRFLRATNVTCSRGDDENLSLASYLLIALDGDYAGKSMKLRRSLHGRVHAPDGFEDRALPAPHPTTLPASLYTHPV